MIVRPTQKLNAKIKAGPMATAPRDRNPFADWTAHLFTADRTQYILLSNTASLYCTLMPGKGSSSGEKFTSHAVDNLRDALYRDGFGSAYDRFIAPTASSIRFCKALNRSVTGSMNELVFLAKVALADGVPPPEVAAELNITPMSALSTSDGHNYASPGEAFLQLCEQAVNDEGDPPSLRIAASRALARRLAEGE